MSVPEFWAIEVYDKHRHHELKKLIEYQSHSGLKLAYYCATCELYFGFTVLND